MKKCFFPIVLSAILFACSSPPETDKDKSVKTDKAELVDDSDKLVEYREFVEYLDSTNVNSSTQAMDEFMDLFSKSDQELCDKAFMIFHDFYEGALLRNMNNAIYEDEVLQNTFWTPLDESGKKVPMPKPFKKLEDKIKVHGYRLEFPEGMVCIGLDRSFIAEHFYKLVSPEMKKFLTRLDYDNEMQFSEDAGIVIDEKEFVERLIWWENFEKEHPDFLLKKRVQEIHQQLFAYFLMGMNNTPSYYTNDEDQTIVIQPYFKTCYELMEKRYPKSDAWKRTKPYLKVLSANDQDAASNILKDYTDKGWITDFEKDIEFYL